VVAYVLTCFRSWDPQITLEPVVQGIIAETEEATRADIKDTAKLVVERFERNPEDV
jgi:hypothetical protein